VMDYTEIKAKWGEIKTILDHKILNHIGGLENSTSEHIVEFIWRGLAARGIKPALIEVRETAHCGAVKVAR
jgi:6-pyruvoyl-tetrahydropterin synthase